jgi:hypothetical protein
MPTKLNVFRALLLATAVVQSVCATANAGEKAAAIYRSRYMLAGFLVRAAAVCGDNKKSFKRFVDAGLGVLGTPELRALSKAYRSTTGQWMKEGGETFNERVMTDGISPACAYALTERARAEGIAREPLPTNQPPVTTQIPWRTCNTRFRSKEHPNISSSIEHRSFLAIQM